MATMELWLVGPCCRITRSEPDFEGIQAIWPDRSWQFSICRADRWLAEGDPGQRRSTRQERRSSVERCESAGASQICMQDTSALVGNRRESEGQDLSDLFAGLSRRPFQRLAACDDCKETDVQAQAATVPCRLEMTRRCVPAQGAPRIRHRQQTAAL